MSEVLVIKAEKREEGKNPRQLRKEGFITGSIYGKKMEPVSIQIEERSFVNAYQRNAVEECSVVLGDKTYSAKIAEIQKNYATKQILNIEFNAIN